MMFQPQQNMVYQQNNPNFTGYAPPPPTAMFPQSTRNGPTNYCVNGDILVKGTCFSRGFYKYCDENLKTSITKLSGVLEKLVKLKPKTYKWKKDENNNASESQVDKDVGFIAQEIQQHFPEIVSECEGYLTVNYSDLIPIIIAALQELIAEYDQKSNENIQFLEEQRNALENIKNEYYVIIKDTTPNTTQKLEDLKKENEGIKKKHQKTLYKQTKRLNLTISYIISIIILAIIILCLSLVFIGRERRPPVPPPSSISILQTSNLIKNPSFELITANNKSENWDAEIQTSNYSLIIYPNNSSSDYQVIPHFFELHSPSRPHTGLASLVMGSTKQQPGVRSYYTIQQTVFLNNTIGAFQSINQANFSCYCDSHNITRNGTKSVLFLLPLNTTGVVVGPNFASWRYIFYNRSWEPYSFSVDFSDVDTSGFVGFILKLQWVTMWPEVMYCDDFSLSLEYSPC